MNGFFATEPYFTSAYAAAPLTIDETEVADAIEA